VVDLEPVVLAWGTAFSVSDVLFVAALVLGGSVLFSILTDVSQVRNDYEDEVEIKGSRQSSPGLLEFLIVGPIKLTLWLIAVSLKLTPSDQRGESDT
jgi:hypothetical protein